MATTARFEPDMRGWDKLALSPDILQACLAEANKGKAHAVAIAPRSGDGKGKPYADSFDVQASTDRSFRNGPRLRVCAFLYNDAPHAAAVEFGNKHTPQPQRVLGRTAAFLGSA